MTIEQDPPRDYLNPEWHINGWRNYISGELQAMWSTFTPEQRAAIARNAQDLADLEEWD